MKTTGKKVANLLFGKHTLGNADHSVKEGLKHPNGTIIEWAGNDGLMFTLYWRIEKLEKEVEKLKQEKDIKKLKTMITKQQVLDNLEEVKRYIAEADEKKEEAVKYIEIKNRFIGSVIWKSTKTTFKEAVVEAATNANLTDADLTGADLTDADLTGADLTGANLAYANLTDANLTDANLAYANLAYADLTGADLTGANLAYANLTTCKYYMGSSNKNFEALCKAIKTIKWNDKTGADFIK